MLALVGYFFVLRPEKSKYSFNDEDITVFFIISLVTLCLDVAWIILYAGASAEYSHSILHDLAGSVQFAFILSIIVLLVKIPFVVMCWFVRSPVPNHKLHEYGDDGQLDPDLPPMAVSQPTSRVPPPMPTTFASISSARNPPFSAAPARTTPPPPVVNPRRVEP